MKYLKEYIIYCGLLFIVNTISSIIQNKEIIEGNIFKLILPILFTILFQLISIYNKRNAKTI